MFQAGNDLFSAFSVFKTSVRSDLRARIDSSSWDPFWPFSGKFTLLFACHSLFCHFSSVSDQFIQCSDWFAVISPIFWPIRGNYMGFRTGRGWISEEEEGREKWWISGDFQQFSMVFDLRGPGKWINHRFYIIFKGSWTTVLISHYFALFTQ